MPHAFPRLASRVRPVAVLLILLLGTACGGDSVFVPKIEDTNFASSLNVDLTASTKSDYRVVVTGLIGTEGDTGGEEIGRAHV